jgi:hypothetical protein
MNNRRHGQEMGAIMPASIMRHRLPDTTSMLRERAYSSASDLQANIEGSTEIPWLPTMTSWPLFCPKFEVIFAASAAAEGCCLVDGPPTASQLVQLRVITDRKLHSIAVYLNFMGSLGAPVIQQ